MRVVKLLKGNETKLFDVLSKFGEVWAPVKKGEKFVYNKITDGIDILENPVRTMLPIKKLLLPPDYIMLDFTKNRFSNANKTIPNKVVVGVHPCELNALNILDKFYTSDFVDTEYVKRRESLLVIGRSCLPDENCFCNHTSSSNVEEGYDLFMTDLGDYYLVWVGSSKGDDVIRAGSDIFSQDVPTDVADDFVAFRKKKRESYTCEIDLEGTTDLMELTYDSEFWKELGEKCLGCGQCTMVCPTCTCFNTIDEVELNKPEGHRRKYWDSCMFKEYSLVAGGHNFREARSDRLKLWYTHKLKAFIGHFGSPSCVGCGRCIVTCPVDINIMTVAAKLKGTEVAK